MFFSLQNGILKIIIKASFFILQVFQVYWGSLSESETLDKPRSKMTP